MTEDDEGVGSAGRPRSHLPATRPFALGGAQLLGGNCALKTVLYLWVK
jgi:hypothetical protein